MASSYRAVAEVEDLVEEAVEVEETSMLSYSFISFAPGVSARYFSVMASLLLLVSSSPSSNSIVAALALIWALFSESVVIPPPSFSTFSAFKSSLRSSLRSSSALRNAPKISSFKAGSTSFNFCLSSFLGGFPRNCLSVGGCSMSILAMSSMLSSSSMENGLRISRLAMGGSLVHSLLLFSSLVFLMLMLLSLVSLFPSPLSLSIIATSSSSSSS
mmetsp:Transcript_5483/g.11939  ORF Transcript_5483/g.11939 Transcript_5483/m.11939 type:complete len:215 (-) Transcript_5483:82-726(-)